MTDQLIFSSATLNADLDANSSLNKSIHIRLQDRGRQKFLTLVEGLSTEQVQYLLRKFKKLLATNGASLKSETGQILQLQGDHRQSIRAYLVEHQVYTKDEIIIHGA